MRLSRLVALVPVCLLLAACEKDVPQAAPTAPEPQPTAAATPSADAAPTTNVAAALGARIASTCRGYGKRRAALVTAIAKERAGSEGATKLKAQLAALDAIIKDACS